MNDSLNGRQFVCDHRFPEMPYVPELKNSMTAQVQFLILCFCQSSSIGSVFIVLTTLIKCSV